MTALIIDNEYKASEAKADAIADSNRTSEEVAKDALFTIYGGIKTQYFTGSKSFNLSQMRIPSDKHKVVVDYLKPTLEASGYDATPNWVDTEQGRVYTGISITWQTA